MQRPSNKSAAIIVAVVLLLPMVYVLSSGPVVWLIEHGVLKPDTGDSFYMPLGWLMEHSPPIESALRRYFRLWGAD